MSQGINGVIHPSCKCVAWPGTGQYAPTCLKAFQVQVSSAKAPALNNSNLYFNQVEPKAATVKVALGIDLT